MRVGPAADTLRHLTDAGEPPFDLVFIDADKDGYPEYLRLSLPLLRPGGLLLGDNTLRGALEPDREQRRRSAAPARAGRTISIKHTLR